MAQYGSHTRKSLPSAAIGATKRRDLSRMGLSQRAEHAPGSHPSRHEAMALQLKIHEPHVLVRQ